MSRRNQSATHCLTCLGVGEGWPSADRNHAAFLLRLGQQYFLFDAGDGVSARFKALGLDYDRLDRVLLSHLHSDHVSGFSTLLQGMWLEKRRRALPIHAPRRAVPALKSWLKATILFDELLGFSLSWEPLDSRTPIDSHGVRIQAFPTRHLESLAKAFRQSYRRTCFEAYSFLVETPEKRFAYSADIGHVDDLDPLLTQPLDLFLCEASHVSLPRLLNKLRGRSIKRLVLTHLRRELWHSKTQLRRQLRSTLSPISITIAEEGNRYDF